MADEFTRADLEALCETPGMIGRLARFALGLLGSGVTGMRVPSAVPMGEVQPAVTPDPTRRSPRVDPSRPHPFYPGDGGVCSKCKGSVGDPIHVEPVLPPVDDSPPPPPENPKPIDTNLGAPEDPDQARRRALRL